MNKIIKFTYLIALVTLFNGCSLVGLTVPSDTNDALEQSSWEEINENRGVL